MNKDNKILIGEETFIFDIDKIFEYINVSKDKEIIEKEITDSYDFTSGSPMKDGKVVREVVTPMDKDADNIRYDLVKMFIMLITGSEGNINEMTFGEMMAFNSLINIGLIKKV